MAIGVTDVQKALKDVDYPADGEELAVQARNNGADDELVDAISQLPEVDGPADVMHELKHTLGDELGSGLADR
jgi:hypothetical protein